MPVLPTLAILAALLYAAAAVMVWRRLPALPWVAAGALGLHLVSLALQIFEGETLRIGINEALSLFTWQSAALLWAFSLKERIEVQGLVLYPFAGACTLWSAFLPSPASDIPLDDWKLTAHILLSLLSAGLLTLAAVHAVTLAVQDRLLHRHILGQAGGRFPPLQTMERLLFQMIAVGFVLLSLTLLTGLWFVRDWMAQHLAHKTVLSVTAWVIFGILLWGRWRHGWRGRVAIRWALTGYATLVLAYFGSKIILEQVLGRHWSAV